MRTCGLVAIILFAGVTVAGAQQVDPAEFEALKAELQSLKQQGNGLGCCDMGCDTGCDPCCRSAGVFFGAEATYLKPFSTFGFGTNAFPASFDYELAPRVWTGYSNSDGLGLQFRYWDFDHSVITITPGPNNDVERLDLGVFDLEAIKLMELGTNWDAKLTGGYRHVDYAHLRTTFVTRSQRAGLDGLTVSGETRGNFRGRLSVFGNLRASVLFGDQNQVNFPGVPATYLDTIKFIYESQVGVEWTRPLPSGGEVFARGALEVQYWDGFGFGAAAGGNTAHDSSALGFFGGTFALGVQR